MKQGAEIAAMIFIFENDSSWTHGVISCKLVCITIKVPCCDLHLRTEREAAT